jgi:hypothetical protein
MEKLYKKVGKRYIEAEPQRFNIDFFEFSFLVEACIPKTPIARAYFWGNVIDKYYFEMTQNERDRLFEWINRTYRMEEGLKAKDEDCLLFNARFDRNNQYLVYTIFNGEEKTYEAFKFEDKYYIKRNTSIAEEYIIKVEKLYENN